MARDLPDVEETLCDKSYSGGQLTEQGTLPTSDGPPHALRNPTGHPVIKYWPSGLSTLPESTGSFPHGKSILEKIHDRYFRATVTRNTS